jgi:hypothetical protein
MRHPGTRLAMLLHHSISWVMRATKTSSFSSNTNLCHQQTMLKRDSKTICTTQDVGLRAEKGSSVGDMAGHITKSARPSSFLFWSSSMSLFTSSSPSSPRLLPFKPFLSRDHPHPNPNQRQRNPQSSPMTAFAPPRPRIIVCGCLDCDGEQHEEGGEGWVVEEPGPDDRPIEGGC